MEKGRWPPDWAGTEMKARPPTAVKGVPRSAMARRAWKPDGPRGLGGVRTRRLSSSTYSIEAGGGTAFGAVNNLKEGEKKSEERGLLKVSSVSRPRKREGRRWVVSARVPPRGCKTDCVIAGSPTDLENTHGD